RFGHVLGTAAATLAFLVGAAQFVAMLARHGADRSVAQHLYTWIPVNSFHVNVGLLVDPLSICFVLLITGVGSLIHLYAVGYMAHDPDRRRFFGYFNLFIAAMLLLVLADNYLVVYAGWEGVGLASYLLIGFWFSTPANATAGNKAFIANRVGDLGMSIAIMIMFASFGTTTFSGVFAGIGQTSPTRTTILALMLLLAAAGKSAQFPLQAWLGDAMAGPTPVSALIHAATMVTAGVYLIVRSNVIFDASGGARLAVLIVGAITLLFGAIVASAKDDIKKSLAGSTLSQIGYMVLAAGIGPAGYAFAIFQLLTHGFFKAGLFLGSGSVIHGMNDEQDMRRYGGLATLMKITYVTFGLATLAIMGVPPFAGFWSKDRIIEAAFAQGGAKGWIFGLVTIIGAGMTAFYMTRMMFMTFYGKHRWVDDAHPHESPPVMTIPLIVLALGSTFLGIVLGVKNSLVVWLRPVVGEATGHLAIPSWELSVVTLVIVLAGIGIGWARYGRTEIPVVAPQSVTAFTVAARHDLYQDAVNESLLMRPGQYLSRMLVFVDNRGVDGVVVGLAALVGGVSARSRRFQTGFVRSYALYMFGGAVLLIAAFLLVRM
ncbi:MAG: NADH-quinone oxidoreductase subunit L, partial [Actinomycetes bacterium]